MEAISERGADLQLDAPDAVARPQHLQLSTARAVITLRCDVTDGPKHGRISVRWSDGQGETLLQLRRWLLCRPGCWQQRGAAHEASALLALFKRLVQPPRRLAAGQRSLVWQSPDSGVR